MPSRALILLPVSCIAVHLAGVLFNAYMVTQTTGFEVDPVRLLLRVGLWSALIYGLLTRDFWTWWVSLGFAMFSLLGNGYLLFLLVSGRGHPMFAELPPFVMLASCLTMSGVIATLLLPGVRRQFRRGGEGGGAGRGHQVRTGGQRY